MALVVYWSFIALAGRPPDSSRYIFVGAALVILIAAEAMRAPDRPLVAVALFVVVAAALPTNIATLFDGRAYQVAEGEAAGAHYGIIELARDQGAEAEVARTGAVWSSSASLRAPTSRRLNVSARSASRSSASVRLR